MGKLAMTVAVAAGAAVFVSAVVHQQRNWERAVEIVKELEDKCETPIQTLMEIADAMVDAMNVGLDSDGGSLVKMLISFVDNLPTGNENGLFYSLDLGGTNFRVLRIQLGGENAIISRESSEVSIPKELMVGEPEGLFGYVAAELAKFVAQESEDFQLHSGREREIGFTFSFPVMQTSINSGTLIRWTKGFSIPKMKRVIVEVCKTVCRRGARLAAAGILRILKKVGRDRPSEVRKAVIAVDGALYEKYVGFRECLKTTLQELLGTDASRNVSLLLANDGSGTGAALIVASNSRYQDA